MTGADDNSSGAPSARARKTSSGAIGNLAFGAIFFFGGLLVVFLIFVPEYSLHRRSAAWERVPATIRSVKLDTTQGRNGETFQVLAEYDYEFGGAKYTGTRVGVESSSSTSASHRERYERLLGHKHSGAPFSAWVNPQNPGESLLFREMTPTSWGVLALGALGVVLGALAIAEGVGMRIAYLRTRRRLAADPLRPWRADRRWVRGFTFPSKEKEKLISMWTIFAVLAGYAAALGGIVLCQDALLMTKAMAGALAAAAVGYLIYAVLRTLRYRKYGQPILALKQVPLVPGRQLEGIVLCRSRILSGGRFAARLQCVRTDSKAGEGERKAIVYEDSAEIEGDLADELINGSAVPLVFDIPEDLPPTTSLYENPQVNWVLNVEARASDITFKAEFALPVFRVSDESLIEKRPQTG